MSQKTLIFLGLLVLTLSVEVTVEDHVNILTTSTFDDFLKENEFVLVKFYAPWCGHCKQMAPEFSKASEELQQEGSNAKFAKVDATVETELAQRFGVSGYPSVKFFINGEPIEFNGGRKAPEIKAWVQKRTGAVTKELTTEEEVTKFKEGNQVAFIYFGDSDKDTEWPAFRATAMENDQIAFGHAFASEAKTGVTGHSAVLYKQFDEGVNKFDKEFQVNNLRDFLNDNSYPILMPFDERAIPRVFQQGNPCIFLFHEEDDKGKQAQTVFHEAAKAGKGGKVLFSLSTKNDGHGLYERLAEYVGADIKNTPSIMLVHSKEGMSKYKYESEITVSNIADFINQFHDDKLTKYLKTEPIPESNDGPVKVIVGKSYDDIVLNSTQDVLVKFYAPWCGHCKALAPVYEKLATRLAANTNLVIAKIDSTANEVPSVNIQSFPTIKFYPSHKKNDPIDYDGGRDEAGFLKWLEEKTTFEWVEPAEDKEEKEEKVDL